MRGYRPCDSHDKSTPLLVVFRETVYMGDTDLTQAEVLALVQKMGTDFKGNRYHLLQRNCNHFATELCNTLVGKPAPYWVGIHVRSHLSEDRFLHFDYGRVAWGRNLLMSNGWSIHDMEIPGTIRILSLYMLYALP